MSIAGIAKEVSTITLAAWFFGDELTPLNITGVAITICGELFRGLVLVTQELIKDLPGIALFTYHKYRKSIDSTVPLDAHGNPITSDEIRGVGVDTFESRSGSVEEMQPLSQLNSEPRHFAVRSLDISSHLLGYNLTW